MLTQGVKNCKPFFVADGVFLFFSFFPAFYQKTGAGIAGRSAVCSRVGVIKGDKGLKSPDFNTLGRAYLSACRNPRA